MTKQRQFTDAFKAEAVGLVRTSGRTSGRTKRQIAEDLGIGFSTLTRWMGRQLDREMGDPRRPPDADVAAELKRLQRENEILRQERDILKRATAFFVKEGSR